MAVVLTLGPVLFSGFEIPESIKFPVRQQLVVHRKPGGARTVDAMGRDDDEIRWSGRFRGSDAETRAKLLHYLAAQGQQMELAWSTLRYQVIIDRFEPDFMQPFEVPYAISCTVVQDEADPLLEQFFSLDTAIGTDLNSVVQTGAGLNLPGVTTAIGGLTAATAGVTTFEGASSAVIQNVQSAIGLAQSATGTAITAASAQTVANGSVAGVSAGGDPAGMASGLLSQLSAFQSLPSLMNLQASLGRMATNLTNGAA